MRSLGTVDDVRVRPASHDDVARLQQIEDATGAPSRELGMDAVADDPAPSTVVLGGFRDRGDAWVLEIGDAVVGYRLDDVVDGAAHLDQVSVDPAFARRGLGRRLIDDLVDRAGRRGRATVTLTTFTEVPWNGPYYARLGFHVLDDDALGPGLRAIRRSEIARGLDRWPRCAMRRALSLRGVPSPS